MRADANSRQIVLEFSSICRISSQYLLRIGQSLGGIGKHISRSGVATSKAYFKDIIDS